MKKKLSIFFIAATLFINAQPKGKDAQMAATLTKGYYCNFKGDTVKGEVQINPTNGEPDFYKGFSFKIGKGKVTPISTKKARAYGFDDRNFTLIPFDAGEVYIEYLAKGRLNLLEYKYASSKGGQPIVESIYFIQDTKADESVKELREIRQISQKFYKKDIKPYMKDQPATWENLDKFTFNKEVLANAVREFNKYYDTTPVKAEVEVEKVGEEPKEETE